MLPELGFGTAPMLGRLSRRRSADALALAYAAGVRHFDTARSYGWGQAEGLLGEFLSSYPRDQIKIVSKCGIVPHRPSAMLGNTKALARLAIAAFPGLRGPVARFAATSAYQPSRTYDLSTLAESFETTLTELRISYVDVLLLHNFEVGKPGLAEVTRWFRELQAIGRAKEFGFSIEGDLAAGLAYLRDQGCLDGAVVQAPVSEALLNLPAEWRSVPIIAHSPFRYLAAHTGESARSPGRELAALLERLEVSGNCRAVVCSMFSPAHIDSNVASWRAAQDNSPATARRR